MLEIATDMENGFVALEWKLNNFYSRVFFETHVTSVFVAKDCKCQKLK